MVCTYCGSPTQVTNSRLQKRANQVWRRRQCTVCGNNFTTHEILEFGSTIAVRRSARELQPFSRDLLFTSVYESCKHRTEAVSDATAFTQTIIGALRDHLQEGVLDRNAIVTVTAGVLEHFDRSAATIYNAYHPATKN
ncbi:MAG: hypothetical protein AAB834_02640 [Patescibacteria group bacterium]